MTIIGREVFVDGECVNSVGVVWLENDVVWLENDVVWLEKAFE